MKYLYFICTLPLFIFLSGCFEIDNKTEAPGTEKPVAELAKNTSEEVAHKDGWIIVSKIENGNRVYWFLPPDRDEVSTAKFKKIIYPENESKLESKTVSQCEAPKQVCDDLIKQFRSMSEEYK